MSETLQTVYRRRSGPNQFFISKLNYPSIRHPDSGFRLFALFRFWNRMQYFNTNREIMGGRAGPNFGLLVRRLIRIYPPICHSPGPAELSAP